MELSLPKAGHGKDSALERDPEQRQAGWETWGTGFADMDSSSLGTAADREAGLGTTPGWQCRLHVILGH